MADPRDLKLGSPFDPSDRSATCPRCGVFSSFERTWAGTTARDVGQQHEVWDCRRCHGGVYVRVQTGEKHVLNAIYPFGDARALDDVEHGGVNDAYQEAVICVAARAPRAGALVCRRAIQLVTRDQLPAEKHGRLYEEIDALEVPQSLKDVAHSILFLGNEAAHPEDDAWDAVGPDDLEGGISLLRTLVQYVYQMPAQTAKLASKFAPPGSPPAD